MNRLAQAFFILCLLQSAHVQASSEKTTSIRFSADRSYSELKKGVTTLEGNVVIEQGNTLVHADKAILTSSKGRLEQVDLQGQPARWQLQPDQGATIQAQALNIRYLVRQDRIELKDQAVIVQGENKASGDYFQLDRKNGDVLGGDVDGGKGRIQLLLPPAKVEKKEETADAPR